MLEEDEVLLFSFFFSGSIGLFAVLFIWGCFVIYHNVDGENATTFAKFCRIFATTYAKYFVVLICRTF